MYRTIWRPAAAIGLLAIFVLAGCGAGDEDTSAGAQAATPSTSAAPTTTTPPATTTTVPSGAALPCANVALSTSSEDVASGVRSTGLTCTEAEALLKKVGPQMNSVDSPSRVETDGFACSRTSLRSGDHGLPVATFDCSKGPTKVTFTRALLA